MKEFLIDVILVLCSGIVGVIVTICTQRKFTKYDAKHRLLVEFVENRYDLRGKDFTKAINKIYIVFNENKRVLTALRDFLDVTIKIEKPGDEKDRKLRSLYLEMCNDLRIDPMEEKLFFTVFNPKG